MRFARTLLVAAAVFGAACGTNNDVVGVTAAGGPAAFAKADKTDPACKTKNLKDSQKGKLKDNSCEFTPAGNGRREDLYTVAGDGPGLMTTYTADAEFSGIFGVTEANQPLFAGTVWGYEQFAAGTPMSFSVVGSSSEYGLFVGGTDSTQLGKYTVSVATGPVVHSCDRGIYLEGTVGFHTALDGMNSCTVLIQYSPYPAAIGKPIWTHNFYAKVLGGHTYTVRIDGLSGAFEPGLTIFGGGVLAQSVGPIGPDGVREVTFTPATTRWILSEVSSGRFVGSDWVNQAGSYGFAFTSN